jgi:hypothetical protein
VIRDLTSCCSTCFAYPQLRQTTTPSRGIGRGVFDNGVWWVKFHIVTTHPLAWRVVQELGHVLNYLSLEEQLPTVFKPVSPPPYLNGGVEFLSWVIECPSDDMSPAMVAEWLEGRLPQPVEDPASWRLDEEE